MRLSMTDPVPAQNHRASARRGRAWLRWGRWLLLCCAVPLAWADPLPPAAAPALDAAILQTQAPGYSRLLVKRRTPLSGSLFAAPAPQLPISIPAAYETALGNNLYTVKLFETLPQVYMQAVARAMARQPDILFASVLNEHGKTLTGVELTVPFPAIHGDQAFDLYVPRKGGLKAPVVLILGCVGGDLPQLPGVPRQLLLPFLATAAAEQYGAVAACMSPAESEADLAHQPPAQIASLSARQAANDAAIQGVVARIGQLTGANTARIELVGGQTAAPGDGAAIALRYALTYPAQIDRLVLDGAQLPALPALPAGSNRLPARLPVALGLTALFASSVMPPNPAAWLQGVRQLAAARRIPLQATVRSYQDCATDLACPIGPTGEMPMLFSALLGPPPAGTALLSLSVGPDRRAASGGTVDLPELISGVVLGQSGSNATPGLGWTAADGGALPAGAAVVTGHLNEKLTFNPQQPGHYAFRLRLQDVKGNTVQAYANVEAPDPALPAPHLAFTITGPAQVRPGARVVLRSRIMGSNQPKDVLYEWRQSAGPAVVLPARNGPALQFTAPLRPAALMFRLIVTDPSGQVAMGFHPQLVKLAPPALQTRPPAKAPAQAAKPPVKLSAQPLARPSAAPFPR